MKFSNLKYFVIAIFILSWIYIWMFTISGCFWNDVINIIYIVSTISFLILIIFDVYKKISLHRLIKNPLLVYVFFIALLFIYYFSIKILDQNQISSWIKNVNFIELKIPILFYLILTFIPIGITLLLNKKNVKEISFFDLLSLLFFIVLLSYLSSGTEQLLKLLATYSEKINYVNIILITLLKNIWLFIIFPIILYLCYRDSISSRINLHLSINKSDFLLIIKGFIVVLLIPQVFKLLTEGKLFLSFDIAEPDTLYYKYFAISLSVISEELLFRLSLQNILRNILKFSNKINKVLPVLLTSIIYALCHLNRGIISVISIFFVGLVFCVIYEKNKNIMVPIIVHFLYNVFYVSW